MEFDDESGRGRAEDDIGGGVRYVYGLDRISVLILHSSVI